MTGNEWLKRLQTGNRVGIHTANEGYDSGTVKRFTKRYIIVDHVIKNRPKIEYQFRKEDGFQPGDSWRRNRLVEYDETFKERTEVQHLRQTAYHLRGKLVIPPTRKELEAFIKAFKPFTKE